MSETIDRLDIEIQAQASAAIAEVDKLYDSLERIAGVLNASADAFTNAKTAIQGTSRAMRSLAKISLPNITTITQQLGELSQMDMGNVGLGASLASASNGFASLGQESNEAGQQMSGLKLITDGVKVAFNGLVDVAKGVASGIGNATTFIVSNFTLIGRTATRLSSIKSLLSGILGPLIGFYGVRSLVMLGKDAVELASDLTEVQNVVDHAFGAEGAQAVEDFVSTSKEQFGLAELAAKQYSSRFQAMGRSMGITAEMVGKAHENIGNRMVDSYRDTGDAMGAMAINLTKLTADMASFYNVEQDTIAQAMNSIYTGQTRPLRQYGIDLTQATLAEWAMKNGIEADIQSMTQAEKAMLRYQYVMAQTSMVQNDFSRTSDNWANQIRLLKQNFQALGATIGNVVINVFKPLITWLNNAMSSVIAFAETIANALGKIFGWTIKGTAGAGGGGGGTGDLADGLSDVGDAADGAGGSLGNANKEAEKLKRTLLGFDEINKLNDVSDTGSGGSGGGGGGSGGSGGGGGGGATAGDFELVKTESIFDQFNSDIQTLFGLGKRISDVLSDAMESIDWQSVYKKARSFGSGLAEFLNGLISPRLFSNLGITIAGAINTVLNAKDAFLNRFNFKNLGYSLAAGINSFFETWDAGLSASVFYKTINGIVDTIWAAADKTEWSFIGTKISTCIREALEGIEWESKVYRAADKFGTGLAKFMNGLFTPSTFGTLGDTIAKMLNTSIRTLNAWASNFNWTSFGYALATGIRKFFRNFDADLAASTFSKLANGILDSVGAAVSTVNWRSVGYKIRNAFLKIEWKTIFASAGDFIVKALNAAIDLASGLFDFPKFAKGVKDIVDALKPAGKGFAEGFSDTFEALAKIGGGVLTGLGIGIQTIAKGLSMLPDGALEEFGKALGIVAASLVSISFAKGATSILTKAVATFVGLGSGAATAGEAVATGATAASGTLVTWKLLKEKIQGLADGFWMNVGATASFTESVEHTLDVDDTNAFVGIINALGVLRDNQVITGNQFNDLYGFMNSNETKGKSLSQVVEILSGKLGLMGVKTSDLKNNQDKLNSVMGFFGIKAKDQQTILDGLGSKLGDVGDKSEGADKKVGTFSTGIGRFIAGILGQTVTMALLGTAYKGIGDKATDAQTPIDNLKTKIDGFVTECKNKTSSLEPIGKDIGEGLTNGVETGMAGLSTVVLGASQDAQTTFKTDNGINSPSTVYKGFGENLMSGLANGISNKASDVVNAIKTLIKNMNDNLTTFATTAKTLGTNIATAIVNGLNTMKAPDLGNKIYTSISNRTKTTSGDFYDAGKNIATAFKNGIEKITMPNLASSLSTSSTYTVSSMANPIYKYGHNIAIAFRDGLRSVTATLKYEQKPSTSITVGGKKHSVEVWQAQMYGSGGFPNYGELFWASESGPEMVGQMGTKNVVANNAQIAEGIENAVVNGMMKVASSGIFGRSDSTPMVLNATIKTPDGDVLARVVEKAQARRDARYQMTTV